ncbi:unnamed protein product [Phytophthora fragariaefolia]|uniref:Unnamed protein product n=1 Tax=Phytophthora fragariaefolia TaxID=1490495 RepID=A0A9W6XGV3_9STRA|nr:unnamed protein product [Phytophthora fragariaefolia]
MADTTSSLFLMEKLIKFVSTITLYGGPSAELYLKNMLEGIWSLRTIVPSLLRPATLFQHCQWFVQPLTWSSGPHDFRVPWSRCPKISMDGTLYPYSPGCALSHKRTSKYAGATMAGDDRRGMTAFNMEEEKDEGHFDADGNFVWDDEAKRVQEEAWLDGVSEQQMGAAQHAKSRREFRDAQAEETLTVEAANKTLATLLKPRESVLQALKRLGSKRRERVRTGSKRKQAQMEEQPAQTLEEKKQFEKVTEAADFLMRSGEVDVYSQIKEEFVPEEELLAERRRVQFVEVRESKSEEHPPKQEVMWEYKAADGQIHGPFPTSSFVAWQQQVSSACNLSCC